MTSRRALAFACAAVVMMTANLASAQDAGSKSRIGGAAYLMPGVRQLQLGSINDRLAQSGYSTLGETALSFGGGGHAMIGRLRIGGEGHFLAGIGGDAERGNTKASVSGGYGMFRLGYSIIATDRFSLYPMIGLGGGGVSLAFHQQGSAEFDQVLATPQRDASMTRGSFLLDAALGADYRIPLARKDDGEGFMLIGLRGSYTFAPTMGGWSTPGGKLSGGPDAGLSGPSVHLLIGFGGMGLAR